MGFSADDLARDLLAARRARHRIAVPRPGPGSAPEAFAVQAAVARGLGPAGAWKVGGANAVAPMTAAPIAASLVRASPCRWPAAELGLIGIEAEVTLRLGRDLPAGSTDPATVRAAIGSVHAAIEIVDSRFDVWPVPDLLAALADNQNNGGLVVEPDGRPWPTEAPARAHVTITADGRTLFDQEGANPGGHPVDLLVSLAGHAARHGIDLPAGTYVTTGSLNGVHFVEPGADVLVTIAGLGRVALTLPA